MNRLLLVVFTSLAFASAADEVQAPPPAKPKVYALVAAMGSQFMATREVVRTGSHLPPWRRTGLDAPDNVLNRLVLSGLDEAVSKMEPNSKRIYLAVAVRGGRTDSTPMDEAALAAAVEDVRGMPERSGWDRIVVATPGYRNLPVDAMPGRTQGFGIFMQPLCQSLAGACGMNSIGKFGDLNNSGIGETVKTPEGETIKATQFVAPYVFLKIWILDARTLAVTDSQEVFEYQKMWNPKADSLDLSEVIPKRILAAQIVELATQATEEAVKRTELRGVVEVKEKGEVKEKPEVKEPAK
jgi:hypothetical protein